MGKSLHGHLCLVKPAWGEHTFTYLHIDPVSNSKANLFSSQAHYLAQILPSPAFTLIRVHPNGSSKDVVVLPLGSEEWHPPKWLDGHKGCSMAQEMGSSLGAPPHCSHCAFGRQAKPLSSRL